MASSPLRSKSHYHARSVSLPSRSHPLIPHFNEHLCRLKASEAPSSSLPSISNRLSGLEDLYDCVDDLLNLPHTQHILAQECHEKCVDEALDGYLKLLDAFATAKDIFSHTKEEVKELLSFLRRKRDSSNFGGYLTSRKQAKKVIEKIQKDLKSIRNKDLLLDLDKDHEAVAIFGMLKEVETVTLAVLDSSLSYAAGRKVKSSGWSLVSKLMHQKSVSSQANETVISELGKVDDAVNSLIGLKPSKSNDKRSMETLQNQLANLELSIDGFEEVLERLLRRLIKTRVSLLNILNH